MLRVPEEILLNYTGTSATRLNGNNSYRRKTVVSGNI
jgi:hypothetical protein